VCKTKLSYADYVQDERSVLKRRNRGRPEFLKLMQFKNIIAKKPRVKESMGPHILRTSDLI